MPSNHVEQQIEAYLNNQLSAEERKQVDAHLRQCPTCARLVFDTKRLTKEVGPTLVSVLGRPNPPPQLRRRVKAALKEQQSKRWYHFDPSRPLQILGAFGNATMVAILALGAYVVIRWQPIDPAAIPAAIPENIVDAEPTAVSDKVLALVVDPPTSTIAASTVVAEPVDLPITVRQALTPTRVAPLPPVLVMPTQVRSQQRIPDKPIEPALEQPRVVKSPVPELPRQAAPLRRVPVKVPDGTIAFAAFDQTPGIETFTTYLINPNGKNLRPFVLQDVSEPALHPNKSRDFVLAVRSWEEPTFPQKLLVSDLAGKYQESVSPYWEDAQPDWSSAEDRVIYASQRESDRHWGLYTAMGNGKEERNLRRRGRAPSFAPDGFQFVFESCDVGETRCGLWVGDLKTVEYESALILADPQAKAPDWSPTGERIAYTSPRNGNWDLYVIDSDGSNKRRLTTGAAIDGLPTWSPDGQWLAFVSDRAGGWGVWIMHLSSRQTRQVYAFPKELTLTPNDALPYNLHAPRHWWDEQISWSQN